MSLHVTLAIAVMTTVHCTLAITVIKIWLTTDVLGGEAKLFSVGGGPSPPSMKPHMCMSHMYMM